MAMQDQSPTRRTVLSHAVAGAAVIASGAASAQPAPAARVKGPLVWLDMDQQALDDAYDQAVYAPNAPQLHKRRQDKCKEVRARLGEPRRLAYGPTPVEMLDIYTTKKPNAPINVFIHGGAWRAGEAWEFCDAAELFVHAGAHFVVPDFIDVIAAGGSLMPIAEHVRRDVARVRVPPGCGGRSGFPGLWPGWQRRRRSPAATKAASSFPAVPRERIWP